MTRKTALGAISALLLAGCAATAPGTGPVMTSTASIPAPSPSPPASEGTQSESPDPTVAASASSALEPESFASIQVNGLTLRSHPDPTAEPVSCFGTGAGGDTSPVVLASGNVVFILSDPPVADGVYEWHRVVASADDGKPEVATACDDVPFVTGWVASPTDGDAWLSPSLDCADAPRNVAELAEAASDAMRSVGCLGARTIEVAASFVAPPEGGIGFSCPGIDPGWLTCGITRITDGSVDVTVRSRAASLPDAESVVEVSVRFDDPAAAECESVVGDHYDPAAVRIFCRTQLVVIQPGI